MPDTNTEKFIRSFADSLATGTFVKATIANYKGADRQLQKVRIRSVEFRGEKRVQLIYRYRTRDVIRNCPASEIQRVLSELIGQGFHSGHLFTIENDLQLDLPDKGKSRLRKSGPTFTSVPSLAHDREKKEAVDASANYLKYLGITSEKGEVRARYRSKWKQINHFIRILSELAEKAFHTDITHLNVADMGCGKGYLTFASYDHFQNRKGIDVKITGIERNPDLVRLGNRVARSAGFGGLDFVEGGIHEIPVKDLDVLIALHACDTATDDAICKGIAASARLILVAPCCHQELRPQLSAAGPLRGLLKYGLLKEREAESVTDALRALLLERSGYKVEMMEFVSSGHTPKNNLIVASLAETRRDIPLIDERIRALKEFYGVTSQRLDSLLLHG